MDLHDGLGDGGAQGTGGPRDSAAEHGEPTEPTERAEPAEPTEPTDPTGRGDAGDPGGTHGGTRSTGGTTGSGTMIVEVGGEARELPAERDYTGDGRPDAAAETPDGRVIVFTDTEDNETGAAGPDGRADEAYVVDKQTGRVVGAAHVDPRTGDWVEGAGTGGSPAEPSPTGDGEVDR